ncbi:hypothetical protein KAJ27_24995 [bacterium]|nr:hypothetical protein [bacterium]
MQPVDAQSGIMSKLKFMTDLDVKPLEREVFSDFDMFYVDLVLEDLLSWGKDLLKKVPSETRTVQFVDTLQIDCFAGDVIIVPGFFNKMDINRQVHKLIRFGIITKTEELGNNNLCYSGKSGIHIFIGSGFYTNESYSQVNCSTSRKAYFINELSSGYENTILKLFTEFVEIEKIKEICIINTPYMNIKEKKRFSGFVSFLKNSRIKVSSVEIKELYDKVFRLDSTDGFSIVLSNNEALPLMALKMPTYIIDREFWKSPHPEVLKRSIIHGRGDFSKIDFNSFVESGLENKVKNERIMLNDLDYFSKIIDILDGILK